MNSVSRAALLEKATAVIVEMVGQLRRGMKLEEMKALNDRMQAIESEADRLILRSEEHTSELQSP